MPLFHLYGDPPDDSADFIHIETIASRSSIHDWTIRAHRHRNLFQVLLIEKGGGELSFETATARFSAPALILVPATTAHGFRFTPQVTDGWVVSFTEDVADALGDQSGEALARLKAAVATRATVAACQMRGRQNVCPRCVPICTKKVRLRERATASQCAVCSLLIAIEVVRLAVSRARTGRVTLSRSDARVDELRRLVDEYFRKERLISFYAGKLAMTPGQTSTITSNAQPVSRLVTSIRQRVLMEAKRQLVFTNQAIHEIAYDLAFSDPSHFTRFFRKQTGMTPAGVSRRTRLTTEVSICASRTPSEVASFVRTIVTSGVCFALSGMLSCERAQPTRFPRNSSGNFVSSAVNTKRLNG